jgi:two-component system phosphate regulon response regulator PhoB
MGVPTVFLVGEDRLPLIPEYLNLGSVVIVAPDPGTLKRWRAEQDEIDPADAPNQGTLVDLEGRRILFEGSTLPLSDLEFRVVTTLLSRPGKAWSFGELRREAWGDGPELPTDIYSVKALIQRLRAKFQVAGLPMSVESVRGYGFRAKLRPHVEAASEGGSLLGA